MKNINNTSLTSVSNKVRPNPSTSSETLGRSMVEMLGVLAIIGVLSAGALAGFNTAMKKHKLNKHLDSMQTLLISAYELSQKMPEVKDYKNYSYELKQTSGLPNGFKSSNNLLIDIFQNYLYFYRTTDHAWGINYTLKIDEFSQEICKNLYILAKENSSLLYYIERYYSHSDEGSNANFIFGDQYCDASWKSCLKNMDISKIQKICSLENGNRNDYTLILEWK